MGDVWITDMTDLADVVDPAAGVSGPARRIARLWAGESTICAGIHGDPFGRQGVTVFDALFFREP